MNNKGKRGSQPVQSGSNRELWPMTRPDPARQAQLNIQAKAENPPKGRDGASPAAAGAELDAVDEAIRADRTGEPPAGRIRSSLPVDAETGGSIAARRGPGRPAGSANKRDTEIAEELIATYGDPLEADVAIGSMPPGELITMLRCLASDRGLKLGMTVGDVLKFQRDCRSNAMPYVHSKRAAIDPQTGKAVLPMIGFGTFAGRPGDDAKSIEDMVENQGVIDVEPDKSDGGKSDDDASD